jgi:hypothetical protein
MATVKHDRDALVDRIEAAILDVRALLKSSLSEPKADENFHILADSASDAGKGLRIAVNALNRMPL